MPIERKNGNGNEYDKLIARSNEALKEKYMPLKEGREILNDLARYQAFKFVENLAERLLLMFPDEPTITKAYANATIELGKPLVARDMLTVALSNLSETDREYDDLHGVLGHANRDIYFASEDVGQPRAAALALERSYAAYQSAFERNRKRNFYHGINLVALQHLARTRDADYQPQGDGRELAEEILKALGTGQAANAWEQATRVEARVALGDWPGAQGELREYINREEVEAFHLYATLRQLRDIWQIGKMNETGSEMLSVLKAAAAQRSQRKDTLASNEVPVDVERVRRDLFADGANDKGHLEKVFGSQGFQSYVWLRTGFERAAAVAGVLDDSGSRRGTAFAIDPESLGLPAVEPGTITLMTNYHVLNSQGRGFGAMIPEEASVRFDVLSNERFPVSEMILFEDRDIAYGLDVTVFTIRASIPNLKPLPLNLRN